MSMIKVENLTFSYPSSYDNIFENAGFTIDTDWKLGFVGRNGRGKTTFLNLLLGKYEYRGRIISSVEFDYFPYHVEDKTLMTEDVINEVSPNAERWRIVRELSYLDLDDGVLYRPFNTLSNGEQTKALLAALFLNDGHFLLIDEPTNHLDAAARSAVAAYLKKKKGFILVSHDRRFLDGCVDHILSINRANIEVRSGNFSTWFDGFTERQEAELAQNERLKKDIRRLRESARRTAEWADKVEATKHAGKTSAGLSPDRGYIGHKSAKMMKRATVIDKRREKAVEKKSALLKNIENAEALKIPQEDYRAETLVFLGGVSVRYGEHVACDGVSFDIKRGERVFLDGKNGSGKSSILKLVCGQPTEFGGTVRFGSGLVISYVPQDTSHLCGTLSDFAKNSRIDESLFKAILDKLDFDRVQFEKDMRDFSGGQKKKALIARSLCERAHLYVWDEPLNFIDLYSRMQIERLIKENAPTMLIVEHDAAFRDSIATKIIELG